MSAAEAGEENKSGISEYFQLFQILYFVVVVDQYLGKRLATSLKLWAHWQNIGQHVLQPCTHECMGTVFTNTHSLPPVRQALKSVFAFLKA